MKKIKSFIYERKNFILYILLKLLVTGLGLITNIFIVRKLSINDYGVFSVVLMVVGLVTTFGFSWSSSSIIYFGSKDKLLNGNINKTFWARNIIIGVSLIIVTILFIVFQEQINDYIGIQASHLILLWLFVSVTEDYLSQYFLAVNRQILSTVLSLTAKIIYLLCLLLLNFDVEVLIKLNILSHASVILYIFFLNKKDIGKFEYDKNWFMELLNFSIWQLFGFAGLYLLNFGDTIVIKHYMTSSDVGIYNSAYRLFEGVATISNFIISYYASTVSNYFVKEDRLSIKKFFYNERLLVLGVVGIGHIILMIFSSFIITFLYGDLYIQAVPIFNVLMVGSFIRYISSFYMLYNNLNNLFKITQYLNIVRAIINILLNIIFIQYFGLIGPAIATVISLLITTVYSFFYIEPKIYNHAKKSID